ncbi:unnamed protein product [[Candida] boidinii]|nr:unnamed protein product [[Candida] boidinii]
MSAVMDELDSLGFIPENLIESETKWFYESLGIDDLFFARESVASIVSHILALYSGKVDAYARGVVDKPFLQHRREYDDHAVYFETGTEEFESKIDDKYLDKIPGDDAYRMEIFNSILPSGEKIKCQFVYKCSFDDDATTVNDKTKLLTK